MSEITLKIDENDTFCGKKCMFLLYLAPFDKKCSLFNEDLELSDDGFFVFRCDKCKQLNN